MIDTIISDIGGVVINFTSFNNLIKELVRYSDGNGLDNNKMIDIIKLMDSYERGIIKSFKFYDEIKRILSLEKLSFSEFSKKFCNIFSLNNEVLDIYSKLKDKFRFFYLSNTCEMHADYLDRKYNLFSLFDGGVFSYKVGYIKPENEIYRILLGKIRRNPKECIFIDDSEVNVEAAKTFGIKSILYTQDTDLREELNNIKVT